MRPGSDQDVSFGLHYCSAQKDGLSIKGDWQVVPGTLEERIRTCRRVMVHDTSHIYVKFWASAENRKP